jgi:hypothetical protein
MCRRQEAHRLLKPSTAFQPKPTAELAPRPRPRGGGARIATPYRRRTTDALRGLSASYASTPRSRIGARMGDHRTRFARNRLVVSESSRRGTRRWGCDRRMCRRQEAHRFPKPSTAFQPKPTAELAPGPRPRGGGARIAMPYRRRTTDALRGLSASYASIADRGSNGGSPHPIPT